MTDTLTPAASAPDPWARPARGSGSRSTAPVDAKELSDDELCIRIRVHSTDSEIAREAFAELYTRHWAPALHFSLRLVRDRARAEDAVAEAFAKIWRAWGNGSGPHECFKSYLLTAVRSESGRRTVTRAATTAVTPEVLTFLAGSAPGDQAAEIAERDQLARAFATLPETWQEAITLIDIDDSPTTEAAAALDLSPNSFSSLLRRAREGLRTSYLQEHVEPSSPDCTQYSSLLARHVRGSLGSRESKAVRAHLRRCRRCRAQTDYLTGLNSQLRAGFSPAVIAAALLGITKLPASPFLTEVAAGTTAAGGALGTTGTTTGTATATMSGAAAPTGVLGASGLATSAGLMTAAQVIAGVAVAAALAVTALISVGASPDSSDPAPVAAPIPITAPTSTATDRMGGEEAGDSAPLPALSPRSPVRSPSQSAAPAAPPIDPLQVTGPQAVPSTPPSPDPTPAPPESPLPDSDTSSTTNPEPTTPPIPTTTPETPVDPTPTESTTPPPDPTTPPPDPTPTSTPDQGGDSDGSGFHCHRHQQHWHCHL